MKTTLGRLENKKGAVLFIAILFSLLIATIMIYVISVAYQRTRLVDNVGAKRTRNYYRAQAGLVDAFWRLRTNTSPPAGGTTINFNVATATAIYYIDMAGNTVTQNQTPTSTIRVDIGARRADGLRPVSATGLDVF